MKTLNQYANEIITKRDSPHELASINLDLGAKYALLSEMYKPLKISKASYWQKKYTGEKPLSDTYLKTQWEATNEGLEELKLKIELDGLEKLMSSIKTYIYQMSIENRN